MRNAEERVKFAGNTNSIRHFALSPPAFKFFHQNNAGKYVLCLIAIMSVE